MEKKKNWRYYLNNLLTGGYLSVPLPEDDKKQIEEWIESALKTGMFFSNK